MGPPAPDSIPLSDIALQAERGLAAARQISDRSRIEEANQAAAEAIPALERETAYRLREARRWERLNYSLEDIRSLEDELRDIEARTIPVRDELTRAALQLERDLKELEGLDGTWSATIKAATEADAPPEVLGRARDVGRAIASASRNVLEDRERVLELQGRATDIGIRLGEIRQLLAEAAERAVTRLLHRDGPPLWSAAFWAASLPFFSDEVRENLENQVSAIGDYFRSHPQGFLFHALAFVGLVLLLASARHRVDGLCASGADLGWGRKICDMPVVAALLLSMLASIWFYPRPPRALWLMLAVLASAPLLVFLRRLAEHRIYRVLSGAILLYLADRLRSLFAPLPGMHRLLLLAEAIAIVLVAVATLHRFRDFGSAPGEPPFTRRTIRWGSEAALLLAVIVLAGNAAGYARLAELLVHALAVGAYTGVILYALVRAGEGIVPVLLHFPPLSFLASLRRHREEVILRVGRGLKWIALAAWVVLSLNALGFQGRAAGWISSLWNASLDIGKLNVSVRELAIFALILWATRAISRLSRFVLEEEVFSRLRLERGLPYAVSTTVHYAVLVSGLVLALTAIGVDMTKVTIVAGALTVGIGFGLQNIVNNFVSGLIVLFERPVKVGDTIQIDDVVGRVQRIGIRATVIHSTTGAEVIVPNGKLISDKVTNWTLSSQLRQVTVPVVTKPDIDVGRLTALLTDIARRNRHVLETPAPEVLFTKRGIDAFEFELRFWTSELDAWLRVRSDLTTEINESLRNSELPAQAPPRAPAPGNPPSLAPLPDSPR